jgi:thioredoxin 1
MTANGNGIRRLKQEEFELAVLKSDVTTVVDFYADWCGPCRMVSPVIESLSQEYGARVNFAQVNTDENQSLAARFGIMSIPTVMIFKDGKIIDRIVGAAPAGAYRKRINAALDGR